MYNEIAASFASLVKSNNGLFKSEKQAAFLLSRYQEENTFHCAGNVYGNSYQVTYYCDAKGVVKVEKHLPVTGKTELLFDREAGINLAADRNAALQRAMEADRAAAETYAEKLAIMEAEAETKKALFIAECIKRGQADGIPSGRLDRMVKMFESLPAMGTDWSID